MHAISERPSQAFGNRIQSYEVPVQRLLSPLFCGGAAHPSF